MKELFYVLIMLVICADNAFAQNVTETDNGSTPKNEEKHPSTDEQKPIYVVETEAGTYRGIVLLEDKTMIVLKTNKGKIRKIPIKKIKYISEENDTDINSYAAFESDNRQTRASSSSKTNGWNTLYIEYNPIGYNVDYASSDDESLTAFSAGYKYAFAISPGTPVFIETGIGIQYAYKNDFYDYDDLDLKMLSAKIPVNLAYRFEVPNSSISLIPFAGAMIRYNIIGKIKDSNLTDKDYNLFDKNDVREVRDEYNHFYNNNLFSFDGKAYKRLQFGWQIGLKAIIGNSFLIGVSYGSDFSEISKKRKLSTTSITLGCAF